MSVGRGRGKVETAENVGIAEVLWATRPTADVQEHEESGETPFVESAEGERMEVEDGVKLQKAQRTSYAVDLVEVGDGIRFDGAQLTVDFPCTLVFVDGEELEVVDSFEEWL